MARRTARTRKFAVVVKGRNFLIEIEGERRVVKPKKVGFFTVVHLAARNPRTAALKAIDLLRKDKRLRRSTRNRIEDPPTMEVAAIQELKSLEGRRRPRSGFCFYPERRSRRNPRRSAKIGQSPRISAHQRQAK